MKQTSGNIQRLVSLKILLKIFTNLKDLGVKIIWLNAYSSYFKNKRKGTLGSYYSISDYKEVNPEFGNKEDLDELIAEAHKNDMLVILDWVANHTGWDHDWIKTNPEYIQKIMMERLQTLLTQILENHGVGLM